MSQNKYISAAYKLYAGKHVIEEATTAQPFSIVTGVGYALDRFEEELLKLNEGDSFSFEIPAAEAYGERDEQKVRSLAKELFLDDRGKFDYENIIPGNVIMLNDAEGNRYYATVGEVTSDTVTVDLNHPLAGMDLKFVGTILKMHDATMEEMSKVLQAMSGGCGGCSGGGCDGCGGGCGGE